MHDARRLTGARECAPAQEYLQIRNCPGRSKAPAAARWAGESDWTITRKQTVEGLSEDEALEKLARKEKMVEPRVSPQAERR